MLSIVPATGLDSEAAGFPEASEGYLQSKGLQKFFSQFAVFRFGVRRKRSSVFFKGTLRMEDGNCCASQLSAASQFRAVPDVENIRKSCGSCRLTRVANARYS